MRSRVAQVLGVAAIAAGSLLLSLPAEAKCKKMGFLVNDYGKDGPTKDAQDLLDKHIAEWAAQNGITNYKVGKKDVTCELYLNLILFDEHTCTASANVCWDEAGDAKPKSSVKKAPENTASDGSKSKDKTSEAVKPAETAAETPKKDVAETAPAEKKSEGTSDEAATSAETNAAPADTAAKPETAAAPAASEPSVAETAPVTSEIPPAAPLETGAIGDATQPAAPSADADLAAKAAAAAERAAAAAERAAAAAERAAEAAAQRATEAAAVPDQVELPSFGAPAAGTTVPPVEPKPN